MRRPYRADAAKGQGILDEQHFRVGAVEDDQRPGIISKPPPIHDAQDKRRNDRSKCNIGEEWKTHKDVDDSSISLFSP
jgi:hypothetical protein